MNTQCTSKRLAFHPHRRRQAVGRFNAGRLTSEGGGMLLRETELRVDLLRRMAEAFTGYRRMGASEHSVADLLGQRIYALALGYEDLNDHHRLRDDSLMALLLGKEDLSGERRRRERDRGHPLASASTLNRLELGGARRSPFASLPQDRRRPREVGSVICGLVCRGL